MTARDEYTEYVADAWPRLFRTAYALMGSTAEAEDLLQATMVKVYVHWRRVQRADAPDAYVRRMLVNQATSVWRARRRRPEVLVDDPGLHQRAHPHDAGLAEAVATDDELWRLVQALPPRQRAVLVLRYYEDLSEQEIARTLGIAPGTVKSLGSAAMRKLRAEMTREGSER